MPNPSVVIVSPTAADANNGNGRTARRWQELLAPSYRVRIVQAWPDDEADGDQLMLALHARRSAAAIRAWHASRGAEGLVVVLTGTDLYGDLATDAQAQHSIACASRLVVLQELAPAALPPEARAKCRVIYQSTTSHPPADKATDSLQAVMVGHLREVKSPQTLLAAAQILRDRPDIRISHIGEASEPALGELASQTASDCPHYRWLGALPYAATRQAIAQAHVLIHTSALEGGAHVIMEAVRSGTPVLASRVDGNVGMLGADYEGYFAHGDAVQLAALLVRCREDQANGRAGLLDRLRAQCDQRASLFTSESERAALLALLSELRSGRQSGENGAPPGAGSSRPPSSAA